MTADYELFRRAFGTPESYVWPGHPITIAWVIVNVYPNFQSAFKNTEHNFPEALGSSEIPGAGGCVYSALDLLSDLRKRNFSEEKAIRRANETWARCDDNEFSYPERWKEGQAQADRVKSLLLAKREWWKKPRPAIQRIAEGVV